jgi:DNA-binding Lrp family transcriptional regulator
MVPRKDIAPATLNRTFRPTMPDSAAQDIDQVDRHILAELQGDGRMTNVELARRVGLSAPPCLRRVRRLEEQGVIRGYHADLDPHVLGWQITFFALVGLETQKQAVLQAFEAMVCEWPEVRECHMIRGGGDFMLRLVARDTAHENQLTSRLTGAPNVLRVQTLQTIHTAKDQTGVPIDREGAAG